MHLFDRERVCDPSNHVVPIQSIYQLKSLILNLRCQSSLHLLVRGLRWGTEAVSEFVSIKIRKLSSLRHTIWRSDGGTVGARRYYRHVSLRFAKICEKVANDILNIAFHSYRITLLCEVLNNIRLFGVLVTSRFPPTSRFCK